MYNNNDATLTVPSLTLPVLESPRVTIPRLTIPTLPRVSYPKQRNTRHVIDLGDLLLGNPVSGTRQLQDTLRDNGLAKLVYVPILNRVVGAGLMLKERAIEPILEGDFRTFGINALETLGHSADILSNPIKSLIPWAHGGTSNDFLKSMGWLDGAYREQYEWDTGIFLVDLIGEIFSDPATLVSVGAKTGTKAMNKAGSKLSQEIQEEFTEQLTKKLGKEIVDEDAIKSIIKQLTPDQLADITSDLTKENSDIIRYISNNLESQRRIYKEAMEDAATGSTAYKKAKSLYNRYNKAFLNAEQVNIDITSMRQSKLYGIYSTLKDVQKGADNLQNAIQDASLYLSGFKPAQLAYQKIITPAFKALYNNYLKTLNKVDPYDLVGRPKEVRTYIKHTIAAKNEAMYKYAYNTLRDRIKYIYKADNKQTNAIIKKLRAIAVDVFGNPKYANNSTAALREMFIERAIQMYPELASLFNKAKATDYQQILAQQTRKVSKKVTKKVVEATVKEYDKELDTLLDAFESYGDLVNIANTEEIIKFKNTVQQLMNDFFNTSDLDIPVNKFRPLDQIKFLNDQLLPTFNMVVNPAATKKMTIADIDLNFLTKLQNIDEMAYLKLTTLLDYLGINVGNVATINSFIEKYAQNKKLISSYASQAANGLGAFDKQIKALNVENTAIKKELQRIMTDAHTGDIYTNLEKTVASLRNTSQAIDLATIINYGLPLDDAAFLREVIKPATRRMKKINNGAERLVTDIKNLKNNYTAENLERIYNYIDNYLISNADDIEPSIYIKNLFNVLDEMGNIDHLDLNNRTILEELRERINRWVSSIDNLRTSTAVLPGEEQSAALDWYNNHFNDLQIKLDAGLLKKKDYNAELKKIKAVYEDLIYRSTAFASNAEVSDFLNAFKGILDDKNTLDYISNLTELLDPDLENEILKVQKKYNVVNKQRQKILNKMHKIQDLLDAHDKAERKWAFEGGKKPRSIPSKQLEEYTRLTNELNKTKDTFEELSIQLSNLKSQRQSIYVPVLGAQERVRLVLMSLSTDLDKKLVEDLTTNNSKLRTALESTKNRLLKVAAQTNDSEYEYLAKCIEGITNKFDTLNIMYQYLDTTDLVNNYNLPKNIKATLQGYLFNAIYDDNVRFKAVKDLTEHDIQSIYKHIIRDLDRTEHFEATDRLANLSSISDFSDALITDKDKFYKSIEEKVVYYIKSLQELSNQKQITDLKLFNFFEEDDIKFANNLGQEYDKIFNILNTKKFTDDIKAEVSSFIMNVAGSRTVLNENSVLNDFLLQLRDEGKLSEESIERYLSAFENRSLAGVLANTYRNIGMTNLNYKDADELLKKLYPGGKALKIHNVINYLTKQEINDAIRKATGLHNIYEFSSANSKIAFKKVKLLNTTELKLSSLTFINEAQKNAYINGFSEIYDIATKTAKTRKYTTDFLAQVRESLKDYYKNNTLDVMPKNPIRFFNSLNEQELIAWHRYTSSLYVGYRNAYTDDLHLKLAAFNAKLAEQTTDYQATLLQRNKDIKAKQIETMRTRFNKLIDDAEHESIISDTVLDLDATTNSKLQLDATDIDRIVLNRAANIPELYDKIQATSEVVIQRNFKSLDSIYDASDVLTKRTKEDITAIERNKMFKEFLADDRTIAEAYPNLSKKDIKTLKSWGIEYNTTKMNDKRLMQLVKRNMEHNIYNSIMRLKPTELRAFIDHNTDGILLFYDPTSTFLNKYTTKEIQEAGLFIKELKGTKSGFYFVRRTDNKMHDALLTFDISKKQIPVIQDITDKINNLIKEDAYYFNLDDMYIALDNFSGEMLRKSTLDLLLNTKELSDLVGNLKIQKTYRKVDNLGQNLFHVREIYRPNMTILGYEDPINTFLNRFRRGIDAQKLQYARTSTAIDKTAWQGTTQAINAWNTEHKYLQLFFNKDFAIDSPAFREAFERATDADIKKFFARNNWDACILRYNRAGRPTVYKISIENKKQLAEAIKLGAVCLPHEAYRNVVLTVNKHLCTSKLINAYQTVIAATFKTIYLNNPGFLMRNYLDSVIYKNLSSTGGFTSILDNFKYQIQAHQLLEHYNKIVKKMTADGVFNTRSIKRVLSQLSEDDKKMYLFMDRYMATGAGGGQIKALQDFLLNYNKVHGNIAPTYLWAEKYRETVLGNQITAGINYINNDIEQTARLALFLNLMDTYGEDFTKAIKTVIDTHFDYELKTPGLERLDQLFWFSTFPINNLFYYMNEGLTKNPEMFNTQLDLMELSWNNKTDYTWEDVRNSKYLSYNALAGNIRFKIAGNDIVLKTGASVFDFLNILMNPIGEAKERLNPFLATALGFESPKELNPLQTPINRINQIVSGQSYLPSVYATLYPKYGRRIYPNKERRYNFSWNIKTKRIPIRKASTISKQMRKRAYNFYVKRYYINKWRPKINRSISIEPYYNPEEGRTARAFAKYTRQMKQVRQNKKRH